jgi:hypothetical protein
MPERSINGTQKISTFNWAISLVNDLEKNLYRHDAVHLDGVVELQLDRCFRSPKIIDKYSTTLFSYNVH